MIKRTFIVILFWMMLTLIGVTINATLFAPHVDAGEEPFLEQQGSQTVNRGGIAGRTVVTKWYDKNNGYCVYTIIDSDGCGISVVKP